MMGANEFFKDHYWDIKDSLNIPLTIQERHATMNREYKKVLEIATQEARIRNMKDILAAVKRDEDETMYSLVDFDDAPDS